MYINGTRAMAWIAKIDSVTKHPDADALDICTIGGWQCVSKIGDFNSGDLAIYVSIDSWVPHHIAPFLSKGKEPREYNSVKGERLRTVRLRGQISQGLLLPLSVLPHWLGYQYRAPEGDDVSDWLGIQKWEAPVPACLAGSVRGNFPSYIPKTNQERIQNLSKELEQWKTESLTWEVTEKLDGSSMTVYCFQKDAEYDSDSGVCSRNLDLKKDENNTFWKVAIREQLIEKLQSTGKNLAIQGELIGEGIQGNRYGIRGHEFFLFDVYDITEGRYFTPEQRRNLAKELDIKHVPVYLECSGVDCSIQELLAEAESKSHFNIHTEQEGLVFKCNQKELSFKVISNKFLLKGGD